MQFCCTAQKVHYTQTASSRVENLALRPKTDHGVVGHEVGGGHHLEGAGPEPSVDVEWLEVGGLAAFNLLVAKTTRSVDVLKRGTVFRDA